MQRTSLELDSFKEKIKENQEKIKLNKQLPYLVGNIVEVFFEFLVNGIRRGRRIMTIGRVWNWDTLGIMGNLCNLIVVCSKLGFIAGMIYLSMLLKSRYIWKYGTRDLVSAGQCS